MTKRYRYITCGTACANDSVNTISAYRLISANSLYRSVDSCIRVELPEDLVLETWRGDGYSTTEYPLPLSRLNTDVLVRVNGKFKVMNELKNVKLYNIYDLMVKKGYHGTHNYGYLTHEQYMKHVKGITKVVERVNRFED